MKLFTRAKAALKVALRPKNCSRLVVVGLYLLFAAAVRSGLVDTGTFGGYGASVAKVASVKRPYGMGIWQFETYIRACAKAKVNPRRVTQSIGFAKASAGFHAPDGMENVRGQRNAYTCALDIRTRDLKPAQIKALLSALHDAGWVAWFRHTGSFAKNQHIHAVFVGYPMKSELRAQVRDAFAGKTGLVGHKRETYFQMSATQLRQVKSLYERCSLYRKQKFDKGEAD